MGCFSSQDGKREKQYLESKPKELEKCNSWLTPVKDIEYEMLQLIFQDLADRISVKRLNL